MEETTRKLISMVDGEIWEDVPNYQDLYQVSTCGRVRSKQRAVYRKDGSLLRVNKPKLMKPYKNTYLMIGLNKNGFQSMFSVHRLVLTTFTPNPHNKSTVNHIDGVKYNNNLENLEWATYKENVRHAIDTGLTKIRRGYKLNLTDQQRAEWSNERKGRTPWNKGIKAPIKHGSMYAYNEYKCRCDECRKANSDHYLRKNNNLTLTNNAINNYQI